MADDMKVRMGDDGIAYPYTSPDLVIDENGDSVTVKLEKINTQIETIADQAESESLELAKYGKKIIAEAITNKGVATNSTDTFEKMADNIGKIESTPVIKTYTIENNLTYCSNDNSVTTIDKGNSYTCRIIAQSGYVISTVSVTMGGTDITSSAYSNGNISISSVTGDVVITVVCVAKTYTIQNNLTYCSNGNPATTINEGNSYTCRIIAQSGYVISTVSVTMGGTDITSSAYSNGIITINSVTGNIVITAVCTIDPDKEVGIVDSSNDITLSGLSAGTYTLKFESDSGVLEDYTEITTMEVV